MLKFRGMLKLYFDYSHYNKTHRGQLFPLLKPFIKGEGYTDKKRVLTYSISEREVEFVNDIQRTDIVILTMSWDYYIKHNSLDLAKHLITEALKANKIVWSVSLGDIGYKLPFYKHVKVFRASGFKSKLPQTHLGMPVFIADPLQVHYKTKTIDCPEYSIKPKIGFCGYANGSAFEMLKLSLKALIKIPINAIKSNTYEFDPVFIASYERFRLLKQMETDNKINTNFIYRGHYRAGANTPESRKQTTLDYFNNIKASQYVFCIRGAGNFSVRFYETLAMGRIPVFVNTDCLVPLDDTIDWKKHVVWIEAHEQRQIVQKVIDFHSGLNEVQFKALCERNRKLWADELSLKGFFSLQHL
jgi:hypothetical protein